jgi:hypothetical protein
MSRRVAVTVVLVAAGTAAIVLLATHGGTVRPSDHGAAETQVRKVSSFAAIELAGGNNVTVRVGRPQAVVVHADRDLLGRVTTVVRSGRLVIGNTPGSLDSKSPMSVEITAPSVSALLLTGSGDMSASGIRTPRLTIVVSGSGVVEAQGRAASLGVTVSGSGDAMAGELLSRDATATVSGSGTIVVNATKSLNASVTGTGSILYAGNPAHVTKSVPGVGAVVPIDE